MNADPTAHHNTPDYQNMMLPLLRIASRGDTTLPQAAKRLAREFALTREQRARRRPGSADPLLHRLARRAQRCMTRAGLLEVQRRGVFRATERGHQMVAAYPHGISKRTFVALLRGRVDGSAPAPTRAAVHLDIADAAGATRHHDTPGESDAALREALIDRIMALADRPQGSACFEHLATDLLLALGYGGGRKDAAVRLGRSGDGGVDAAIRLDPLGLDLLYLQAKCRQPDAAIDVGAVRDFSGSLDDKKTSRGVFVTTARFTKGARDYVRGIPKSIVLIDGCELTRLMVAHGVGVRHEPMTGARTVDEDYFRTLAGGC